MLGKARFAFAPTKRFEVLDNNSVVVFNGYSPALHLSKEEAIGLAGGLVTVFSIEIADHAREQ